MNRFAISMVSLVCAALFGGIGLASARELAAPYLADVRDPAGSGKGSAAAVALSSNTGLYQGEQDEAKLLRDATASLKSGRYEEAERLALEALKRSPASSAAMYLLGHAYEREKNARSSLEWFTRAAAIHPPTGEDLRTVGLDYVLLDDYPDAIHWLERAVTFDVQNSEAWYDLGRARMMQGDSPGAEIALKRSLALDPKSVKAENNLGVNYESENRPEEALKAYILAVAWQSASPLRSEQPLLNLGTLLVTQRRGASAVSPLDEAVRIAPLNVKAREQLALALEQAGRTEDALSRMRQSVALDHDNPRMHYELGQMLRRAGKATDAREELRLSGQLYGSHSTPTDR